MVDPGAPGLPPGVPLAALVRVGHEVEAHALRLGLRALSVEIAADAGLVVFSYDQGRVEACARGWELELSALESWERDRPPGL